MELNKVYLGDCLEVLKGFPNESVDIIITSPPYNLGGDFHTMVNNKRISYGGYNNKKNDNLPEDIYQKSQEDLLVELHRILKPEGILFYNHKNRIKDGELLTPLNWIIPSDFTLKQQVVLDFKSTPNHANVRFYPIHEHLYVLTKSPNVKLNNKLKLTDIWFMPKNKRVNVKHPATFHKTLPDNCLQSTNISSGVVLDPYCGSGTTLVSAKSFGFDFIGIEVEKEYKELSERNLGIID